MDDLSHLAADSMWPTSQTGSGSTSSERPAAMTAPGSPPAAPGLAREDDSGAPHVEMTGYDGRHTERGER